jgi:hypothetical protein
VRFLFLFFCFLSHKKKKKKKKKHTHTHTHKGPRLHEELQRLALESPTSWIEGFWDAMYLEARSSVAVDWNPAFVLRRDAAAAPPLAQLERAARLAHLALLARRAIADESFPPDVEGAHPLHMRQHVRLFASARIPRLGRDAIVGPARSSHIAVLANGHIYAVDVLAAGGAPVSQADLRARFAEVHRDAWSRAQGPRMGLLTTLDRDRWAGLRSLLLSDPRSQRLLKMVDEAQFVVSLDGGPEPDSIDATAKQMLVGHGCERWFDKWIIAVTPAGQAGFNLEHAPYDGHTFVSLFNYMAEQAVSADFAGGVVGGSVQRVDPGELPGLVKDGLRDGRTYLEQKQDALSLSCLELDWGSNTVKKLKSSPDAFMQLSLQLAHVRLYGRVPVTYESGNVKRFLAGRTETIRPVTEASSAFALGWDKISESNKESRRLLYDAAAQEHVNRVAAAKSGAGWDRHLFALRNLARHKQQRLPDHAFTMPSIFEDPSFARYFNIELSTSNSGALPFRVFSFAPVIPDGLGVGYQTFPEAFSLCVTSYTGQAKKYADAVNEAFTSLRKHLQ